jgi:hypothetical protein
MDRVIRGLATDLDDLREAVQVACGLLDGARQVIGRQMV